MPPHVFKRTDGFEPEDFIHSGIDHVNAAESLFKASPSFFDSAGYLVHMGFELILKAWHLEAFGEFCGIHSLQDLAQQLQKKGQKKGQKLNLLKEETEALEIADKYGELRYPNPKKGVEVGSDDWNKLDALLNRIWEQTPTAFDGYFQSIDPTRKGGRVLMERKIEKPNDT